VGDNTSQKDDGNIAGIKCIVGKKNRALMRVAHNDCHFTMLGFWGIPTFMGCRERGRITPEILKEAMENISSFNLFDRKEAIPALLLDGHGSRFDLHVMDYVNAPATKWCVLIRVPYGVDLWQVADSSGQNGSFKCELKRAKQFVIRKPR